MAGEMKASPRNPILGTVADKLAQLKAMANKYEILPQVPLLGGTGIGDLLMGQAPEEVSNWSYGNAPMQIPEMSRIPQMKTGRGQSVADAMFLGADVGALGGIAAKLGARGLGELAGSAGRMMPVGPEPQLGVIKPKGGNWDEDKLKFATKGLNRFVFDETAADAYGNQVPNVMAASPTNLSNKALNSWIEKTLQKYAKNEMATPEDPIRLLAERGITHRPPMEDIDLDLGNFVSYETEDMRRAGGFPEEGMGRSELAKYWENVTDNSMWFNRAKGLIPATNTWKGQTYLERMPWLEKVDPDTPIYGVTDLSRDDLGFRHLIDELANATDPNSGLPPELLLKYESLPKVTVPQAVERVAKINEWRAKQKAEADAARAMNPATQVFKEYPEGYKWVELTQPKGPVFPDDQLRKILEEDEMSEEQIQHILTDPVMREEVEYEISGNRGPLADALKYEGETMGHCVGGYCPDVLEGRSKIYSLRDAKGMPHVTVEVGRHKEPDSADAIRRYIADGEPKGIKQWAGDNGFYFEWRNINKKTIQKVKDIDSGKESLPSIIQIKGKANKAPKKEYLPFVQDFVKSQQWSEIGDFGNTGLIDIQEPNMLLRTLRNLNTGDVDYVDRFNQAVDANPNAPRYMSQDELKSFLGLDQPPQNFAQGGMVTQYDPARIETLVSQLMDE